MKDYKFHPAAEKFPLMKGTPQWAGFVADIAERGQRLPIVLFMGMILDGRNRYLACMELGIKPKFVEAPKGIDPEAAVVSMNVHRRHLSKEQQDSWIKDCIKLNPQKSNRAIADENGVHHKTIARHREDLEMTGAIAPVEKVTGQDGRTVKARHSSPKLAAVEAKKSSGKLKSVDSKCESAYIKHKPLFDIADEIKALIDRIDIAKIGNPHIVMQEIESHLKSVMWSLTHSAPYKDCPYCKADGCKVCRNTGWVTSHIWKLTPENIRQNAK